jgi:hypothetical protein
MGEGAIAAGPHEQSRSKSSTQSAAPYDLQLDKHGEGSIHVATGRAVEQR